MQKKLLLFVKELNQVLKITEKMEGRLEESLDSKDGNQLLNDHKDVVKLLRQGYSVRKTMKLTDMSSETDQKVR